MNRLPSYGYLLLLAALFAFGWNFVMMRKEKEKKDWPSVPGKVLGSSIERTTRAHLQTPTVNRTTRDDQYYTNEDVWALNVQYEYTVDGRDLSAFRATATDQANPVSKYPNGPSSQMVEWKSRFPVGVSVPVHYNPTDPSDAYLIYIESTSDFQMLTWVGCVLLVLALALIAAPIIFR